MVVRLAVAALAFASFTGLISFVESPAAEVATIAGFASYIAFHFWVLAAGILVALRSAWERGFEPGSASYAQGVGTGRAMSAGMPADAHDVRG